jgi:predicted O-linked N-acetylglucosamine transferase (SPINDLY family)
MVDHLDRQRCADLFLDTQPYTGHATTSLALWAGLPVLTILGNTLPGRVSASLLRAIEMPELIAPTQDAYEEMAVDLATNPDKLRAIKAKLDANRLTTPLFDTARFARHLEAAFTKMHARAGQPPVAIHVPALRDPATAHR